MELAIEMEDGTVERLSLTGDGPVTVGREDDCHVVLPSPDVSRVHLQIEADGGTVRIRDSSANGTFYGEPEQCLLGDAAVLAYDEPFQVGPYRLRVVRPEPARAAFAPAPPPPRDPGSEPPPVAPPPRLDEPTTPGFASDMGRPTLDVVSGTGHVDPQTRSEIRRALLSHLGVERIDGHEPVEASRPSQVRAAVRGICREREARLPGVDVSALVDEMTTEALGLGALERLLADRTAREVFVSEPGTVFVERAGRRDRDDAAFSDADALRTVVERLVAATGGRIDADAPFARGRLPDGHLVRAWVPPAGRSPGLSLHKVERNALTLAELIFLGTLDEDAARELTRAVAEHGNVVVSGNPGSGRTTLLAVLAGAVGVDERVVTVEAAPELRLRQTQVVSLLTCASHDRSALVAEARALAPDRLLVDRTGPDEAEAVLAAMRDGDEAVMTTVDAPTPEAALDRLGGAARALGAVDWVVHVRRYAEGVRRVVAVCRLVDDGGPRLRDASAVG